MTMREIAANVVITERAVQKIVNDLAEGGYVKVERKGRRNLYGVVLERPLRHPVEEHKTVKDLIRMVHGRLPSRR